jgi:predicted ribosome quality control (RQC) complex YloA/Tae2 family protein
MKLYEIKAVAKHLSQYNFLKKVKRVQNNTLELDFADKEAIYFDLTRGNSSIYKAPTQKMANYFNAPFDAVLNQLLSHSKILDISTPSNDKVIIFKLKPKSQYKDRVIFARFELTGKHTNLILTDEDNIILEALHHIDASKSFRVVKPGIELEELLPFKSKFSGSVEDVNKLLEDNYIKVNSALIKRLKSQKLNTINKKIQKLQKSLNALPNEDSLLQESAKNSNFGNILLANLHNIKPYDKLLKTYDFNGNEIEIKLPKNIVKNRLGEYFFNLSKRAKNKSLNVKIERENLSDKLNFYLNIKSAILNSKTPYELELLLPKQSRQIAKQQKQKIGELYWIEGYKVMVGRNSKENQELLSLAKSNDIWMHTRALPGSHVIIRTDKQNLPETLLQSAAKLCVDFTTKNPGNYEVDYTKRKFVKLNDGSNVEYDKYKTISILKEGIEIRE